MGNDEANHWAYRLPDLPDGYTPWWARETVADHAHPEYWAWMGGWSREAIEAAKVFPRARAHSNSTLDEPIDARHSRATIPTG